MASKLKATTTVLVLLGLVAVPAVASGLLGFGDLSGDVVLATLSGLIAAAFAPWRHAVVLLVLLGLGAALAVPAGALAWLAVLVMVACGAGMGLAARYGDSGAFSMAPISIGFILSEPPDSPPGAVGLAVFVSAGFGVALGSAIRRRVALKDPQPLAPLRAAIYGTVLALLAGTAAWFVVDWKVGHAGAWLLMTFFVVVQPYLQDGWTKALQRAAGTVLGFVIAMAVGLITQVPVVVFVIGVIAMVIGVWVRIKGHPYWRYTTALTVGIVLAEGASSSVVSTAEQRLIATVVGVTGSLLAMVVLQPLYKRAALKAGLDHY